MWIFKENFKGFDVQCYDYWTITKRDTISFWKKIHYRFVKESWKINRGNTQYTRYIVYESILL